MPWVDLPLPANCGDNNGGASGFSETGPTANGLAPSRNGAGSPGLGPLLSAADGPWSETVGASSLRGVVSGGDGSRLWAVFGQDVHHYLTSSPYTKTVLAATLSGNGVCRLIDVGTHVVVVDENGQDTRACTVAAATTVTPPAGYFKDAAYQDGYTIYARAGTDEFYVSALDDPTTVGALDFSTADALPGNIVGLISNTRELVIFKEASIEFWQNTGAAAFPFERQQPGVAEVGCRSKITVQKHGGTIFWIGGDGNAYRMTGYQPERISFVENGGERLLSVVGALSLGDYYASASVVWLGGSPFYYVYPGSGSTRALYDIDRNTWSVLTTHESGHIGPMASFRNTESSGHGMATAIQVTNGASGMLSVAGKPGDSNRIEVPGAAYVYVRCGIITAPIVAPRRATMHALEIHVRATSSPTYYLAIKDDGAVSWEAARSAVPQGGVVRFARLGRFTRRQMRIHIGDDPSGAVQTHVTDEIVKIRALIEPFE